MTRYIVYEPTKTQDEPEKPEDDLAGCGYMLGFLALMLGAWLGAIGSFFWWISD